MKQNIKNYLIIFVSMLFFTVLLSLILTIIEKNTAFSQKTLIIIGNCVSYAIIALSAFFLGIRQKKHGLIHGIIYTLFLIALSASFSNINGDIMSIVKMITKSMIVVFFTILGVNKKSPN